MTTKGREEKMTKRFHGPMMMLLCWCITGVLLVLFMMASSVDALVTLTTPMLSTRRMRSSSIRTLLFQERPEYFSSSSTDNDSNEEEQEEFNELKVMQEIEIPKPYEAAPMERSFRRKDRSQTRQSTTAMQRSFRRGPTKKSLNGINTVVIPKRKQQQFPPASIDLGGEPYVDEDQGMSSLFDIQPPVKSWPRRTPFWSGGNYGNKQR